MGEWVPRRQRPYRAAWAMVGGVLAITLLAAGVGLADENRRADAIVRSFANTAGADPEMAAYADSHAPKIYERQCAACHGPALKGDRLKGAPDLTDADWLYGEGKAADIEQTILYGVRSGHAKSRNLADMPAFGTPHPYAREALQPLTPAVMRDLVEFLRQREGLDHDAAAAARGAEHYQHDGGCFDCHGADLSGDSSIGGPNLLDHVWLTGDGSRTAVVDAIAHGRAGVCPAFVGRLKPAQIRILSVWISRHAAGAPPTEASR